LGISLRDDIKILSIVLAAVGFVSSKWHIPLYANGTICTTGRALDAAIKSRVDPDRIMFDWLKYDLDADSVE
jgi:hypothetical protein